MKMLFCHGWTSTPGGRKPTYLREQGHEVVNPAIPDDDFDEAARIWIAHKKRQAMFSGVL